MVARIACLALTLGFLVGCYNIPTPECGFACGPAGACPSSYACNASTNRCELDGTQPTCDPALVDAGTDADRSAPNVISQIPQPRSVGASLDVTVIARFDEPVIGVDDTTFRLEHLGSPVFGTVSYVGTIDSANFKPSSELSLGQEYTAIVTTGIVDLEGNPLASEVRWTFTTAGDITPPMVVVLSPAPSTSGVDVATLVVADFSEGVIGVNGSSFTLAAGAMPVGGSVTSPTSTRAQLTPSTQLAANTTYTARLGFDITDFSFNSLPPVTWTFTTGPDTVAPTLVLRSPAAAGTNVAVNTDVTASFDETVIGVSGTSFTLTPQGGSPVGATVTYAAATRTALLIPTLQLAANTQHTATLTGAITDGAANALSAAPISWSFTTGADAIAPSVASISPAHMATGVPITTTIVIAFDEPVLNVTTTSFMLNGGALTGTIAMSAGNTIATFTPDAALPASTLITIDLTTAITDAATTNLVPVSFSFTTGP